MFFTMYFDHIHPSSAHIHFTFLHTQLFVLDFENPTRPICVTQISNIIRCEVFHWRMVNLIVITILKIASSPLKAARNCQ